MSRCLRFILESNLRHFSSAKYEMLTRTRRILMQTKQLANRLVEPTNSANTATNTMLNKMMIAECTEIIFRSHKSLQDDKKPQRARDCRTTEVVSINIDAHKRLCIFCANLSCLEMHENIELESKLEVGKRGKIYLVM